MVTSLISASGAPLAATQHLICLHCCSSFTAGSCSACCPPGPPGSPQLHLSLFNSVLFLPGLSSSLSWSCEIAHPSDTSTSPPSVVSSANLGMVLRVLSSRLFWWCCKVWVPPSFLGDPPLVTGFQTELKPLTCTFWVHPVGPVSCPFCRPPSGIFLVCPGGGCGKQCQMLCWSLLNSICCSHYVDRNCYFVAGAQKGLARFVYCETALAFPNHLFHLALGKRDSNYIVLQPDTVIMGAPWMFS